MAHTRTTLGALALLALASTLLLACGGDDDDDSSGDTSATRSATATEAASATASPSAATVSPEDVAKDTSDLTYRVVYEYVVTDSTGATQSVRDTRVNKDGIGRSEIVYVDDPSKFSVVVQDGEGTTVCDSATAACVHYQRQAGDSLAAGLAAYDTTKLLDAVKQQGATVNTLADTAIAGVPAECHEVSNADHPEPVTWCFGKENGILLRVENEYEVKEFSGEVATVDLTLPEGYPVTEYEG